jgi:hypothetical protein
LGVTSATPPAFIEPTQFPVINFNPELDPNGCGAPSPTPPYDVRPFTDLIPHTGGTPCATQIAADHLNATPTLQAGLTPGALLDFYAEFTGQIYVPAAGDVTLLFYVDDDWVLGVGPRIGGSEQPRFVNGVYDPAPPPPPTPGPLTTFRGYPVVTRYQVASGGDIGQREPTVVYFPSAGYYPMELDYTECNEQHLEMVLGSSAAVPIPNGPSPTPTFTCIPSSQWCVGSSVNVGGANSLNGVAAIAQTDVWVGGWHTDPTPGTPTSLLEHWDGLSWNVVSIPTSIGPINGLVVAPSVTPPTYSSPTQPPQTAQVWAGSDTGIILWDGTAWSNPYPGVPGAKAFAGIAPTDLYAAGGGGGNIIQHWNGLGWATATTVPAGNVLNGITAFIHPIDPPGTEYVWAVGSNGSSPMSIWWNGSTWATVAVPTPVGATSASLSSVTAINNADLWALWAVGTYTDAQGHHTLTEYYNSDTLNGYPVGWFVVPSPNPDPLYQVNELHSVWRTNPGDLWAAGTYNASGVKQTLILHWNGSQWDISQSPDVGINNNELNGITSHSPATSDWAAGYAADASATPQTLVESLVAPVVRPVTKSYYEVQVTPTIHSSQGCNAAATAVSGVVVLDYGRSAIKSGPVYGTILISSGDFASIDKITTAAEAFADGYDTCRPDHTNQRITMALSVNDSYPNPTALSSDHGQQWAHMVATVQAYATTYPGLSVAGGIDAEEGSNWDPGYTWTYNWVSGFLVGGTAPYYDFGAVDNYPCPPTPGAGTPTPVVPYPYRCSDSAWNVDQHYQIAYGLSPNRALPLLETYTSSKTGYIYPVTRWGKDQYNKPMKSAGQMTGCWVGCDAQGVLSATQGWPVLWLALNGDRQTSQSPPNSTNIVYSDNP